MDTRLDQTTRLIEIERAQIGHEIHDGLLPLIFAASASVGNLLDQDQHSDSQADSDDHRQRLKQIASWLDDAMQTGRRLLTQVYPPELVGAAWTNVAAANLQRLLGEQSASINWDIDPEINAIEPHIALAAYRIVIEAVRNSFRHGNAKSVSVRAARDADHWQIVVTDDGDGFDTSKIPEDRFGIRAMRGRAELVDGALTIDSCQGGPTTIAFRFPHTPG